MTNKAIEEQLTEYFKPVIEENGFELYNIDFVKEGPNWYLTVYIDKPGGITIDDCELVSKKVDLILEEKDPIKQAYILEVSSPGVDRPLKKDSDYEKYKGEIIDIKLYKKVGNIKKFSGTLVGLKDDVVTIIDENNNELQFKKADIASCRLAIIF